MFCVKNYCLVTTILKLPSKSKHQIDIITIASFAMPEYSFEEYADMHFVYGECSGNANAAVRRYEERFPQRRVPDRKTILAVAQRLRTTGSVLPKNQDVGRGRDARIVNVEEEILHRVDEDPSTSTRQIAREVGVSHWTVWRTLKESLLYPYHVQRVQSLTANDFCPRRRFCEWLVRMSDQNPLFHCNILMTDECCFTRNGILHFHNTHHWAEANPHIIHQSHFQHRFGINVWAGIIGSRLVGPFVLPARLTGEIYLNFLRVHLPGLLEEIPLQIRRNMWFMHDGAPAHFTLVVRNFLNTTYGHRWIGRGGPTAWPPRSPDLNSCDFYLWGYMKYMVYATPVNNQEDLLNRIMMAAERIRNDQDELTRVSRSLLRRANACIRADGGHFEHFL